MKTTINILCATDKNYSALCGIMLTSLFDNNKESDFCIYMLTDGIYQDDQQRFEQLAIENNAKFKIIQIKISDFLNCPIWPGDHLSIAAYYRLMVSDLLPKDVTKILYLDCDIIVNEIGRAHV